MDSKFIIKCESHYDEVLNSKSNSLVLWKFSISSQDHLQSKK